MTQIEMQQANAIINACRTFITTSRDTHDIDWEQRRYELAKEYAIGLLVSKWFDGTKGQAIDMAFEFADEFINTLKLTNNNGQNNK